MAPPTLTGLTSAQACGDSHLALQNEEQRTRRATATVTSRPVGDIQRGFMASPPFPRSLPLLGLRAL